jgi:hypothetical protein
MSRGDPRGRQSRSRKGVAVFSRKLLLTCALTMGGSSERGDSNAFSDLGMSQDGVRLDLRDNQRV